MISLILALTITTTAPTADVEYLGALLCGECCGMPEPAMWLTAQNIALDYLERGLHWLPRRWYAPLKPNEVATEMMRQALELETFMACRLVGNGSDRDYWLANGYAFGEPDYEWNAHGLTVVAFDCRERAARARPVWSCEGDGCPM